MFKLDLSACDSDLHLKTSEACVYVCASNNLLKENEQLIPLRKLIIVCR